MKDEKHWQQPYALNMESLIYTSFPTEALPSVIKEYAVGLAETTCSDPAMAATACLSAVSYCFTAVYRVLGKKDHSEPLLLDAMIIAPPSAMKSPVIRGIEKEFEDFETLYNEEHKLDFVKNQKKRDVLRKRIKIMEKDNDADIDELARLQMEFDVIKNYKPRSILIQDITPESLTKELEYNGSLLMLSDEAGILSTFSGRYNKGMANLDLILKSWNGEMYISNRVSKERITIHKPYVSMCLATQPYMWNELFANRPFRESGFIARMIYCFPDDYFKQRKYNTLSISDDVKTAYNALIVQLLKRKMEYCGKTNNTEEQTIYLDDLAGRKFECFFDNYIQRDLRTEMAECRDWGGKYHGLILRIAGILHCLDRTIQGEDPVAKAIDFETMNRAIKIGLYYRSQAIQAYKLGTTGMMTMKAENLIRKIQKLEIKEIKQGDLLHHVHCQLYDTAKDLNEVIEFLIDFNYVRRFKIRSENGGNRPGYLLVFNPYLFN
ncbi:Protein of unknown function [Ruminococcaceae bacterium FB2012]|nr:Protein of unknown function [Ruminococcaceae bacterium FB2012]